MLSDCVDYVIKAHVASKELSARQEYGFIFFNPEYTITKEEKSFIQIFGKKKEVPVFYYRGSENKTDECGMAMLEYLSNLQLPIDFCTVTDSYKAIENEDTSYSYALSRKSGGVNIDAVSYYAVVNDCLTHIYGEVPENANIYKILIATNFDYVNLYRPITEKYIDNAIKYGQNYIYDTSVFDEDDLVDCADTDDDGLWDFQEIKVFKGVIESPENQIIKFENGKLVLPNVNDMTKEVFKDMYSAEEIDAFREHFAAQYGHDVDSKFWQMSVLPINSNPQMKDTDGDGLNDNVDIAPFFQTEIPNFFKQLIINNVVEYSQIVKISDDCYICTKRISNLAESDFIWEYISNENDISYEDWQSITLGVNEEANYCDCLASVYVGNDVVYFAAPFDVVSDELMSLAYQAADSHRKAIISPMLEDDISYQAVKSYSERLNSQQKDKNDKFEDYIDSKFNSNELYEMLGFYDEKNGWRSDVIDFGSSAFDSFYKSACRCVYYFATGISNARCTLMATNAEYIEYVTWYRHEYPNSSFVSELGDFISVKANTTAEIVVLDINDRLLDGTAESRGEVCGEVLFDIFLDVAMAKVLKGISAGHTEQELLDELGDVKFRDGDIDGNNAKLKSRRAYWIGDETFTVTLRPENHKKFAKIISKIDQKYKSEFISVLNKYPIEADDIIERFCATSKHQNAAVKALNAHFDDFVKYSEKFDEQFVKVFATYPQHIDDIIKWIEKNDEKFFKLINDYPDYADNIISLSVQRGEEFLEKAIKEGAKGDDSLKSLISRVTKPYNEYSLSGNEISYAKRSAVSQQFINEFEWSGLSSDDFFRNRETNHNSIFLDNAIKQKMAKIRESVPFPDENTWMSKVIPQGDIEKYLSGERYQVSGFVTKADDVANCKNYMDYYDNLALGYSFMGEDGKIAHHFYKNTDTELGVIRFKSKSVNQDTLRIPYGKGFDGIEVNGKVIYGYKEENLPFTGNGFAGGKGVNCITPEYEFAKTASNEKGLYDLMDGAELYKVTQDGDEILMAIYNKNADNPNGGKGMFVRLEDIK